MHRYLLGYIDTALGRTGHIDVSLPNPIRDYDDIKVITQMLRQQGHHDPVIVGFSRYEEDQ